MTKTQKLRNLAEGLMAGLVECGFEGPFRWAHHEWEGAFYRVWNRWPPASRPEFPKLALGGSADGRTSQARVVLWQLKKTSPFYEHDDKPLTKTPMGLAPREYLEIWCEGATPDEWVALAQDFLEEMAKYDARRSSPPTA